MELRAREYYGIFAIFWWGYILGRLGEHYALGASPIDYPIGTTVGLCVITVLWLWVCYDDDRKERYRRIHEAQYKEKHGPDAQMPTKEEALVQLEEIFQRGEDVIRRYPLTGEQKR